MSIFSEKNSTYFPGLNGVRCIAACGVVIRHIEQYKELFRLPNISDNLIIRSLGEHGVNLFFVLSGFLITYLFFVEEKENKKISIKKFYLRRAMRILPLYFLILALGFFIAPALSTHLPFHTGVALSAYTAQLSENYWAKLLLFALILPNLCLILFPPVLVASQAWSIGVEEQFYLLWPLLFRFCKRHFIKAIFSVLAIKILIIQGLRAYLPTLPSSSADFIYKLRAVYTFTLDFKVECLAFGALGAVLLFRYPAFMKRFVIHRLIQIPSTLILVALLGFGSVSPLSGWVYAILYTVLLVNISQSNERFLSLEGPKMNFFGKISYGIYMYHPISILIGMFILDATSGFSGVVLYILTFIITFALSSISYFKFEKPFLNLKQRFESVPVSPG
jgi:peptidoglycan/LPS O-acetylase OafA/YrhL